MHSHMVTFVRTTLLQLPVVAFSVLLSANALGQTTGEAETSTEQAVSPAPVTQSAVPEAAESTENVAEQSPAAAETAPSVQQVVVVSEPVAPPPAPEVHWYTYINNQNQGPFSQSEMEKMVATGLINHTTKVNKAGTPDWVEAQTVFAFKTPPPPAPAPVAANTALYGNLDVPRYLEQKARHVRAGNVMTGIGIIGSGPALGMQIAGIIEEDEDLFFGGLGMAVGFGGLRFAGVIVSAAAARKYTRIAGKPLFSLGPFSGGLVVGAVGTVLQYAVGQDSVETLIGIAVGTEVLRDIFWIVSCVAAKNATAEHRNVAAAHKPQLALAPVINPRTGTYGLSFGMNY